MSELDKAKNYTQFQQQQQQQQSNAKQVIILGSGFAGIEVLKRVQKKFKKNS